MRVLLLQFNIVTLIMAGHVNGYTLDPHEYFYVNLLSDIKFYAGSRDTTLS